MKPNTQGHFTGPTEDDRSLIVTHRLLPVLAAVLLCAAGLCADRASSASRSARQDEKGFVFLFGKSANDGWAQCGPGGFTLANGIATGQGGMGLWWHTNRMYTNFVLRGEWVQEQDIADSGVFFRFPDPGNDPWVAVHKGHEMEIGDPKPEKPTDTTGSIYPFSPPTSVPVKPYGQWNTYEITAIGHTYTIKINGVTVNAWTDPQKRSLAGYVGLQNYNDGKTVRHRRFRIKELPSGSGTR